MLRFTFMSPNPFRRTKIIATLGPATESEEMLIKAHHQRRGRHPPQYGPCQARLDPDDHQAYPGCLQKAGHEIAIMMDVKGPEIRTGDLETPWSSSPGNFRLHRQARRRPGKRAVEIRSVDVNYQNLINDIHIGDTVLVDNGLIRLEVLEKHQAHFRCRVLHTRPSFRPAATSICRAFIPTSALLHRKRPG